MSCGKSPACREAGTLRFAGAIKLLVPANDHQGAARVQYGALYVLDTERREAFVPNDEISAVTWWDGSEALAPFSTIDRALAQAV